MTHAVAIIAYDRPRYFERVVTALSRSIDEFPIPCYFFLDGGSMYQDQLQGIIVKHFRHAPAAIIKRSSNWGCGRNIIAARQFLFDDCKHTVVTVIEDDLVISRYYLRLLSNMLKWAEGLYSNIAMVQAWNRCLLPDREKEARLSYVCRSRTHLWGYAMTYNCWTRIRTILQEYERRFLSGRSYASRDHEAIRGFFRRLISLEPHDTSERAIVDEMFAKTALESDRSRLAFRDQLPSFLDAKVPTGQDAATNLAVWFTGQVRLASLVNRALYIGKSGIHSTPRLYRRMKLNEVRLAEYDSDCNRAIFSLSE